MNLQLDKLTLENLLDKATEKYRDNDALTHDGVTVTYGEFRASVDAVAKGLIALGLKKGDKVVTSGGIYGLVEHAGENTVTLKVAENTKVKFGRQYIASVRSNEED